MTLNLLSDMCIGMAAQTAVSIAVVGIPTVAVVLAGGAIAMLARSAWRDFNSRTATANNVIPFRRA